MANGDDVRGWHKGRAYAVLQVVPTADGDVIRAAYRVLARRYHPDHSKDPQDAARMVELNAAWELIGDPKHRAAYDLAVALAGAPAAEPSSDRAPERPSGRAARSSGSGAGAAGARGAAGANGTGAGSGSGGAGGAPGGPSASGPSWAKPDEAADASRRGEPDPPPPPPSAGRPFGSVLDFGRYRGWSLGQIARHDPNYLEWFRRTPLGRRFSAEIEALLEPAPAGGIAFESARTSRRRTWPRRG